jgi:hypothetical protein
MNIGDGEQPPGIVEANGAADPSTAPSAFAIGNVPLTSSPAVQVCAMTGDRKNITPPLRGNCGMAPIRP